MRFLLLLLATGLAVSAPADAQRRLGATRGGDQDAAYRATQQGDILSLQEVRSRVRIPNAEFIGVEFDGRVYRLKYMRGGEVIWIDVDARTGRIIGRQ